ncbi:hypothetical protein F4553_007018 [Allocatelliglobosispora scoriae]|uniref:Uncharacterized protein n=1 Tax=Allocatelliglobosispora scoriae TaxID=643052 RepID=A0A841BZM2_9ACTN|nr:hypothetical protein [Allocatelliglobosispora scoriae]MBB5873584.1 hypothetical protein [Allocatelliglobosispora scoriae]
MTDSTTEGYEVSAAEIEGMVRNLCGYALGEPDPLLRYADLTHQQVLFDGIVAALQRARGRAVADLIVAGTPIDTVATTTNLATVARVKKLVSLAGETERVKTALTPPKAVPAKARKKAVAPPDPVIATIAVPVDPATANRPPAAPPAVRPPAAVPPAAPPTAMPPSAAVPPRLATATDKRVLTAAELEALGIGGRGSIPTKRPRASTH